MFEREFVCEGINGKEYKETWCFYLSKADMVEINYSTYFGLDEMMKRLIDSHNGKEIMGLVRTIILKSVGRPSADGRRFIRNDEIRNEFESSDAYSQLFTELVTTPDKLLDFIASALPSEMGAKLRETAAEKEPELLNKTANPAE
jgi:hypothetical protein